MEFCQLFNFYRTAHPFFLCQSLLIRPGSGIKQHPQIHHSACVAVITKEICFIGKISHGNKLYNFILLPLLVFLRKGMHICRAYTGNRNAAVVNDIPMVIKFFPQRLSQQLGIPPA